MECNIQKGNIIKGPMWPEPVKVDLVESLGDYIRIVGVIEKNNNHIDNLIGLNDLPKITILQSEINFEADPKKVFLSLEAKRYRYISLYDPLLAINTSKVDPLPHQIEAVYEYILKLPRIRFMIADDPGAGKTIMAGLIIKELKIRHQIKNILIVVPGHLKDQWRRELKERFEEVFMIIDRNIMDSYYGENVWKRENQILTSIDFAKRDDILPSIDSVEFDLIIVDEAHKMTAYKYGEKTNKSERYKLGEVLSRRTPHLLFLTATPHKGDIENFRLFLDLLEPGFFATDELLKQSISNKENPLFVRRIKEDLKDFEGKPLFLPRYVKTIAYNLGVQSQNEKKLYNELSDYVNTQYNKAQTSEERKKRNISFALVILQRRFASSTFALFRSLERRKNKLTDLLNSIEENKKKIQEKYINIEEIEDLSEEERWKEEEQWETISMAENKEELKKEIDELEKLSQKAKSIIDNQEEIKLKELKDTLDKLNNENPKQKIIIFTESKDTLNHLESKIKSWGYLTNVIHGGMKLEERVKAESVFKLETQVMVATEAAGEGINLQFCHLMINYDIPWNPNRLEQRMGRIHRYGQNKEVYIYNLVAIDTREGEVLSKLFAKLEEIRNALGSDKVFDVLSEVLEGTNLSQLLLDAAVKARTREEILSELEIVIDEEYINKVKENLGDTLATRFIDYSRIKELAEKAREYKLIPEYTESFFAKSIKLAGSELIKRKNGLVSIESVPYEIRNIANDENFKKVFGLVHSRYRNATFDKDIAFNNQDAEFISFGHPLFESSLRWIEKTMIDDIKMGAVFSDPDGRLNGYIAYYEGGLLDGNGDIAGKRLFAFYIDKELNNITNISPSIIWDLSEGGKINTDKISVEQVENIVFGKILFELENYKSEQLLERNRQAEIKEKYGVKSLDFLIYSLGNDLLDLKSRKEKGENVDIVIYNKEEQLRKYRNALEKLKEGLIKEKNLSIMNPKFIGVIRVVPISLKHGDMFNNPEVERKGMEIAMKYELDNNRNPEDVSAENLGFDIRSTDKNGNKRYIEVKARAGVGVVSITQNEWFKANRFKDNYYLYVAMNVSSTPELYIIQNPAEKLKAEEKIEIVRFIITSEEIISNSKIVNLN